MTAAEPAPAAHRSTRQGHAVLRAVEDADGFRSAQEIHADLRASGTRIGLATVYRQLPRLADDGAIDALTIADGRIAYRRCKTNGHHHHLVCQHCGNAVEVKAASVERWAQDVAARAGYTDVSHTVEIFGTCPVCAAT